MVSATLHVWQDRKGKYRTSVNWQGGRILVEHAKLHLAKPDYEIGEEIVPPFNPYIKLQAGAITERPPREEETITSVRLLKSAKVEFSIMMANMGLTTCQGLRKLIDGQLEMYRDSYARMKPPPKPD